MSRRATLLLPGNDDGTSQRGRALPALDPASTRIDERSSADLLAFVQAFASQLRYFATDATGNSVLATSNWDAFAQRADISIADMVAYVADPTCVDADKALWLGRPHFALLLTFLELLAQAREQLNGLTERHLDYFYRDILQMQPLPAEPDRAAVVFRLAPRVSQWLLPAGTALEAGRDSWGVAQIYRTERELVINAAQVAALKSVFVDRRVTGISDARKDPSLTAAGAFNATLRIALGAPSAGDPVPKWRDSAIDHAFITSLRAPLDVTQPGQGLYLEHYELRALMRLVRRRDAGAEWPVINGLMGLDSPSNPRDFNSNLDLAIAPEVLDFSEDGLPQVASIDDLFFHSGEAAVRAYIDHKLANIGYDKFCALMPLKLRVDAEWVEIVRMVELAGQRKRNDPDWQLADPEWQLAEGFDPTAFGANLSTALEAKPPDWTLYWNSTSIYDYEAAVRDLEVHLGMPVERLDRLVGSAERLVGSQAEDYDWGDIDQILGDAHREQVYAARRAALAQLRGTGDDLAAFDRVVSAVLDSTPPEPAETSLGWAVARQRLASEGRLGTPLLELLDSFRKELDPPTPARVLNWPDFDLILELAWRSISQLPDPVPRKIEWRNLDAYEDARACTDDPSSTRWKTFGARRTADPDSAPPAQFGWAVRSSLLGLSQGSRTVTVTVGFEADGFDAPEFLHGLLDLLNPDQSLPTGEALQQAVEEAIRDAWVVQLSTARGWIDANVAQVRFAPGTLATPNAPGDNYWTLSGQTPPDNVTVRAALQLRLLVGVDQEPIAAPSGIDQPALRVLWRQRWDAKLGLWTTLAQPFEPVKLAAVLLQVAVDGLSTLQLQQDDRTLDPRKPAELFGGRPEKGTRLYLSHPELIRECLDTLTLHIDWMGLPADLPAHYASYGGEGARATQFVGAFKMGIALIDRNLEIKLAEDAGLFFTTEPTPPGTVGVTADNVTIMIDVSARVSEEAGYAYVRRPDLLTTADLRLAGRYLRFELQSDMGHGSYAALAALRAREFAAALIANAGADGFDVSPYQINAPYTPSMKRISASYTAAIELQPGQLTWADRLMHLHPFGESAISADEPTLMPLYDQAGELYIGIQGLVAPQRLSLLLQLAEGTSDPDIEPAVVSWCYLSADRWLPAPVAFDSTRGLLNSGIVELSLPAAAPGTRLPGNLYWLRLAIPANTGSVCDCVDIRAQAVGVRFEDRGNAPDHYAQPMPVGSISRLSSADAHIAAIEQPFTSFGGKAAEEPARFRTRVSERLRHKQRAVTPWDYERLVLQGFGQIYKAKCLPANAQQPGQVQVIVIPDIRNALPGDAQAPKAPANLLADIQAFLSQRAAAAAEVIVRNARYVPVRVRLSVRFIAGQEASFAKRRLNDDLVRYLSPWAFDEGAELMIGGRIYANSLIDFIDRRDYVDYVTDIKLFRDAGPGAPEPVPVTDDYHIATRRPDEILVAASEHDIDVISDQGKQLPSFTGIGYMKIELDFIVHA